MLYASLRFGSGAVIVCAGSTAPAGRFDNVLGNAGAPRPVPFTEYVVRAGRPFCWIEFWYTASNGWSYMMPVLARMTWSFFAPRVHATPSRGPKLLVSSLKLCKYENGAFGLASG